MAKYCPMISYQKPSIGKVECIGKECAFADKDGDCLIAKALTRYVDPIAFVTEYKNKNKNDGQQYHTLKLNICEGGAKDD